MTHDPITPAVTIAFRAAAACLLLAIGCSAKPLPADKVPLAKTGAGMLQGEYAGDNVFFKGAPYAAAPVGVNRWRPPAPASEWDGVRTATTFGPDCIQPSAGREGTHPQSEDCLTLNVAAPAKTKEARRPVLFFIHGGAFFVGAGRQVFDAGMPLLVDKGIVIVAPNYRVGRMGFFAHPALRHESNTGAVANYWLMDQIAALEWVKENITQFGGDPDNVTILGCSAGGSSVNSLVASPLARGLFHKAVARSGGGLFNATRTLEIAEQQGMSFAARAGVTGLDAESLSKLRTLNPDQVLAADPGPPNFGAMIDGAYLPRQISVSMKKGEGAPVPYIAGSTSNEASIYGLMGFDKDVMKERFDVDVDALRPYYEADGALDEDELLRQVQTDFIFTSASIGMAALSADAGRPSRAYYFDYTPGDENGLRPGANHCEDMRYLFAASAFDNEQDQAIADMLQGQLINFMRSGDPNGEGLPQWPEISPASMTPLVVRSNSKAVKKFRSRQMKPWFEKWEDESGEMFPDVDPD